MKRRWWHRLTGGVAPRRPARQPQSTELILLRAMCHELRPPISVLGSLVRSLSDDRDGHDAEHRTRVAQLAYEYAMHMDGVLRQVAAVTQPLEGPVSDQRVPLHRILPAIVAVLPPDRLIMDVSPAAGRFPVRAQHTRQVLMNLLDNAARHGPVEGPVRLHARTAGLHLWLAVSDDGNLTEELRSALQRCTPPVDLSGLGLWIVRHLVAVSGGRITARPVPSGGVTVEVVLPRR